MINFSIDVSFQAMAASGLVKHGRMVGCSLVKNGRRWFDQPWEEFGANQQVVVGAKARWRLWHEREEQGLRLIWN